MMDLSDKGSECEDTSGGGGGGASLKTCVDCGTSRTPLWRGGPAGPKSLCNACGIRSRKKRRVLVGGISDKKKKSATKKSSSDSSNSCTSSIGDSTVPVIKKKMWALGREVALQRPRSNAAGRRRKFGREEEQAAFLLMALSCGSVYA